MKLKIVNKRIYLIYLRILCIVGHVISILQDLRVPVFSKNSCSWSLYPFSRPHILRSYKYINCWTRLGHFCFLSQAIWHGARGMSRWVFCWSSVRPIVHLDNIWLIQSVIRVSKKQFPLATTPSLVQSGSKDQVKVGKQSAVIQI